MFTLLSYSFLVLWLDVRCSIPAMEDVHLGSHRSRAVVQRDYELVYTQLERFSVSSGCPLTNLKVLGDFANVHAYFEAHLSAKEVSTRSTNSLDFEKLFRKLMSEESEAQLTFMLSKVGPNGGGCPFNDLFCCMYVRTWFLL